MVSSCAERGVRRTMGCEAERISIALAPELDGAELREAFDVVAEGDEGVDAADEVRQRLWACGGVEGTFNRPEADAGDLAGALRDGEVDGGFVVFRDCLDIGAVGGVFGEGCEGFGMLHALGEIGHDLARGLHDLADRIAGEEIGQEEPEPLHAEQCTRTGSPADSNKLRPTNCVASALSLREAGCAFSYGFAQAVSPVFASSRCHPGRSAEHVEPGPIVRVS